MAEKRMFTQKIIDSDAFLEMPLSAQALYFHLNMRADDDGFVNNPKRVTKLVSASEDDLKILLVKRFIIGFASGVIVIKHWRMHNTLRQDRYHPTDYQDEFKQLGIKENKAYTDNPEKLLSKDAESGRLPDWQPNGNQMAPENRLGLDKSSKEEISNKENGICAEPVPDSAPDPPENVVATLLLNDGSAYSVGEKYVQQMQQLYPNVNVWQEILKMSAWCINNPKRRKTKNGITRFINSWLANEQNRGRTVPTTPRGAAADLHESYRMMEDWANDHN